MKLSRFSLFVISIIAALIIPNLFRPGMFMDGTLYSSVAVNYARGLGDLWHPHFAKDSMSFFHEQPPLMFFLEGLFFKALGEGAYVERLYSLLVFMLSLIVFLRIRKELFGNQGRMSDMGWFAPLVWVMIPTVPWVVVNNMEENTMGLFVLLSVLFLLRSFSSRLLYSAGWTFLASLSLTAAFLTKGFPGLFPVCLPVLFLFFDRERAGGVKKIFLVYSVLLLSLGGIGFFLFSYPPSKECLGSWLFERVLNSIKNVSTTNSRLHLIWFLFQQLIPVFALGLVLLLLTRIKNISVFRPGKKENRTVLIFLLLAVSGSFPLIVTKEQRGFYLDTSYPYYAIAAGTWLSRYWLPLAEFSWGKRTRQFFRLVPALVSIGTFMAALLLLPVPKRDAQKLSDIERLCTKINRGDYIAIPEAMWNDWELHTGLVRGNYISLTADRNKSVFLLTDPPEYIPADTSGYKRLSWELQNYVIYTKTND